MTTLTQITSQTHQHDLMRRGAFRPVRGTGRPSLRARLASRRSADAKGAGASAPRTVTA
jgi:hypothetical protein